jgi:hypothetical protein
VLPTYFYLFDSLDLRRDVTIAPYNVAVDDVTKLNLGSSTNSVAALMNPGKYQKRLEHKHSTNFYRTVS